MMRTEKKPNRDSLPSPNYPHEDRFQRLLFAVDVFSTEGLMDHRLLESVETHIAALQEEILATRFPLLSTLRERIRKAATNVSAVSLSDGGEIVRDKPNAFDKISAELRRKLGPDQLVLLIVLVQHALESSNFVPVHVLMKEVLNEEVSDAIVDDRLRSLVRLLRKKLGNFGDIETKRKLGYRFLFSSPC